jgi:uncharacterized protein (DUF1015 family)
MVTVHPFPGITPHPAHAPQVAALPYDVLTYQEACALVKNNPLSFLRVEKSEVDFGPEVSPVSTPVFEQAAANLARMLGAGTLIQDQSACFYLYQQQMGEHIQTGLVAGTAVADYHAGKIKKHEFTRTDKEDERTFHVDTVNANTGPVFLTCPHRAGIDQMLRRLTETAPEINFVAGDGIRHTLWKVADPAVIAEIEAIFRDVPALYIADGHHRAAAAAGFRPCGRPKIPATPAGKL